MFGRLVDVYLSNETDTIHLVNSELGNKTLKCKATINCIPGGGFATSCTLSIYNINRNMINEFNANGYKYLVIKFGYKDMADGTPSTIFEGTIQRMIVERQDPTTSVCIMYAYQLGDAIKYGFFSGTLEKGISLYDACMTVAHKGEVDIPLICTEIFKNIYLSTTESYFDTQMNVIQKLVDGVENIPIEMQQTLGKLYINTSYENESTEVIVMSGANENGKIVSASGLINMPTLEDDGLSFDCLINPNLHLYSRVLISNPLISWNQEGIKSHAEIGASFDSNGIYVVTKITISLTNGAEESKMSVKALARDYYNDSITILK